MPKSVSMGGQMRTYSSSCGWSRRGNPIEVDKLFRQHRRYCPTCKEIEYEYEPFNKADSMVNGWKNDFASATNRKAVVQINGETFSIDISGVTSSEHAVNEVFAICGAGELHTEEAEVLTKSKKRRIKLKARKEQQKQDETDK